MLAPEAAHHLVAADAPAPPNHLHAQVVRAPVAVVAHRPVAADVPAHLNHLHAQDVRAPVAVVAPEVARGAVRVDVPAVADPGVVLHAQVSAKDNAPDNVLRAATVAIVVEDVRAVAQVHAPGLAFNIAPERVTTPVTTPVRGLAELIAA